MWLETLIVRLAERKLLPYRKQVKALDADLLLAYTAKVSEIERLYQRTTHWHGTGRYHYVHRHTSRYKDIDTSIVSDIMLCIINARGLQPHHDPWIDSGGDTVSLATTRMHARTFARVHTTDHNPLAYELGSMKFWLRLYFALLFVWLLTNLWSHRTFISRIVHTSVTADVQNWASAIRKPKDGKVVSVFDVFGGNVPLSDIEHNYPILFGIHAKSVSLIETIPLTHKVEQRSLQPVSIDAFTHVEVPFVKVKETKELLQQHALDLPVIALEFGDMYLSNQPLRELAFT